jgi:hypothetical protein
MENLGNEGQGTLKMWNCYRISSENTRTALSEKSLLLGAMILQQFLAKMALLPDLNMEQKVHE